MENIYTAELRDDGDYRRARVGARAGAEHLGLTVYELASGQGMHFHYHLQREELLVVLEGTVAVRGSGGWEDVPEGGGVAFPRGGGGGRPDGNRGDRPGPL